MRGVLGRRACARNGAVSTQAACAAVVFRFAVIFPYVELVHFFWAGLVLGAGLSSTAAHASGAGAQHYPDVVAAKIVPRAAESFDFDVTISSPYDTPQRYAGAFRVLGKDGTVFGVRKLAHDHAYEQPFTRDLHGVSIPSGVRTVVIQARDQNSAMADTRSSWPSLGGRGTGIDGLP